MTPTEDMNRAVARLDTALTAIIEGRHRDIPRSETELRAKVRDIGEELAQIDGICALSWALDVIELGNPDDAGHRIGLLDACWDGIYGWCA